ncbi:MAG TPA: nickel insertion protein [bacterium]|nr:nickel insertion protein [bacterium]
MSDFKSRKLIVLESNLDDMNPEWCEILMDRLFDAGALDVWFQPIVMKKNRPAFLAGALAEPKRRDVLLHVFFEETTTLGVRVTEAERFELARELKRVRTPYGEAVVKVGRDAHGRVLNASPEHESCKTLAKKKGVPLKKVYQAALKSFKM